MPEKRKALIVEHREDLQRDLVTLLSDQFQVHAVSLPAQILPLLRQREFDLLILDLDFPSGNGPEAARGLSDSGTLVLDLLGLCHRFGGRLVLLRDRSWNEGAGSASRLTARVQLTLGQLPLDLSVLTEMLEQRSGRGVPP